MSANPDDKDRPDPRQQFRDRLSDIRGQRKGAIIALCVLGGFCVLLVTQSQQGLGPIATFTYGVAAGIGAISMVTNVGALNGHKISAEIGLLIAEEIAELRAEMREEIAAQREMLLAAVEAAAEADQDELARQRSREADAGRREYRR